MELEGLRVVAAVVVVLFHAALLFYPSFYYGLGSGFAPVQNMRFEDNIYQNPLAGLLSGTFAVGIFFVLSGFVLSVGFFQSKDPQIVKKLAAKRYLRLMLPALASILIVWLVMSLGLTKSMATVTSITHSNWLGTLWTFPPDLFKALIQGSVSAFTIGDVTYNPVLWTIRYEMIGSFIVFAAILIAGSSKYRWVPYAVLVAIFSSSWLLGFIIGMIFADLYVNKVAIMEKLNNKFMYILLALGIFFGGYPAGAVTSPLYKALHVMWFDDINYQPFFITVGASFVVLAILALPRLSRFFATPRISSLGKYTYSIYLLHMSVLFTACTGIFVLLVAHMGLNKAALLSVLLTVPVMMIATFVFHRYIEVPAMDTASYFEKIYSGKRSLSDDLQSLRARLSIGERFASFRNRSTTETDLEVE